MTTTLADQIANLSDKLIRTPFNDSFTGATGWAACFNVEPESDAFYSSIIAVRKALLKLEHAVKNDENLDDFTRKMFLEKISPLVVTTSISQLAANWQNVRNAYSQSYPTLKIVANFHRVYHKIETVSASDLDSIIEELEQIKAETESSTISEELRDLICSYIAAMTAALKMADVLPADGLWDLLFKILGDVAKTRGKFRSESGEKSASIYDRITNTIRRTLGIIEAAEKIDGGIRAIENLAEQLPALIS